MISHMAITSILRWAVSRGIDLGQKNMAGRVMSRKICPDSKSEIRLREARFKTQDISRLKQLSKK